MMKKFIVMFAASCLWVGTMTGCSGMGNQAAGTSVAAEMPNNEDSNNETLNNEFPNNEIQNNEAPNNETAEDAKILVAAAASLKNVYEEELIPMFKEKYPEITVEGTYDSSGKLQSQIEEGLDADVFMSAAQKQMEALDDEGLIASETIVNLLENKIVLIVPLGSEEEFSEFTDIGKAESVALGDPASVPAGQYAEEALMNLGLWDTVSVKASLGTNVTEVLNQVAEGSADAGIVYATDAASMPDKVSVVAQAPEGSLADKVIYPVAVVKNTGHREAAERFTEFLASPEAMEVFVSYGFSQGE